MRAAVKAGVLAVSAVLTAGLAATPAAAQGGSVGGSGARYYLNDSFTGSANTVFDYGDSADEVYVGDWDGNGTDTLAVRRGNTFYVRNSNSAGSADVVFSYGDRGDVVLVGDWDGNGTDTLAVRRGNTFYVKNSVTTGVADTTFSYGDRGDVVLVGDWDGNATDTLAVRRGGQYFVKNDLRTGVADRTFLYGDPGDVVLVGRWSKEQAGDSLGVRRGATYYLRYSLTSGAADRVFGYGDPGDTALVGDWNGDGTDTLGVRRYIAPGSDWLGELNRYRTAAGLSPTTENPAWTAGLRAHLTYLQRTPASYFTGEYANQHTENPASPYYSADGDAAGRSSNLVLGGYGTPVGRIDGWLTAPFHAIGMLRPGLRQAAFADVGGYAALDVIRGYQYQAAAGPVLFPGPGLTTNLNSFDGNESPNPLETCGWQNGGARGLALIAMLPSTPAAGASATVTGRGGTYSTGAGTLCLVDQYTFRTSDGVYGQTGASLLQGDRAVFLIASAPYAPGTYTATLNQPGGDPITWSFTIG